MGDMGNIKDDKTEMGACVIGVEMFLKRKREKRKVGSCFGSVKEEEEAETLIKDKRLFLSLSFLLCASATFTALLFFPSSLFFLIYCSGKHIPPLSVQRL